MAFFCELLKNCAKPSTNIVSEDDKRLQEELVLLVEKLKDKDEKLHMLALETLRKLIRTSTTSMTSVPKPLKYLRSHFATMKEAYLKIKDTKARELCADIISVLAMAVVVGQDTQTPRECLKFCLLGSLRNVGDWGHEYVRQLEGEIAEEWATVDLCQTARDKLLDLVKKVVKFDMTHNAEIQACDLLMEIDRLELVEGMMDVTNYPRVCLYLSNCSQYVEESERTNILKLVVRHYLKFKEYPRALCIAMQLNDTAAMKNIFDECKDLMVRKQLAYMAGRQQLMLEIPDSMEDSADLRMIMTNAHINDHFNSLARELDITEPKSPEEVFKTWLESVVMRPTFHSEANIDSARHNLASSFVNAFVNAGFGRDKLIAGDDGKNWIYRNKEHGMMSATASLGLIHLWDVDGGLSPIDRYLYITEDFIKAGALLALGLVNTGVKNECDPAKALLMEYVLHNSSILRIGSILGLGLAYAGSNREDIIELIIPALNDPRSNTEVIAIASLALGLIAVGTCHHEVTSTILQVLLDASPKALKNTYMRFLPLALGLCYLGRRDATDATDAALDVLADPFKSMAQTTLQMCAYAGTGDVLFVQELLHICSEHHEPTPEVKEEKKSKSKEKKEPCDIEGSDMKDLSAMQAMATLGVAVVSMGEEQGADMSSRIFGQLARYGEPAVRRAVPLALALLSISNPQPTVIDMLNKYSHDTDFEVAHNAIISMGLVGAGTNNARLATMLRQMALYHTKNPSHLFMVRMAQGLTHMGKGTLSLSPFHTDRQILSPVALAGLLILLVSCLDIKNILLGKSHYLFYILATAMHPRWLVTLDEDMEPLPVSVRIGQAIDIVGKAGTPKTIAGIHTNTTPVLLAVGERAELATEEYTPLTPVMEGFVILRKKPNVVVA